MAETRPVIEPYQDGRQQHEAAMMGMYIFLASEVMLFGGLFAVAAAVRILHPADVVDASKALHRWIGAGNTLVLLTSSLCVALAVEAAKGGRRGAAALRLVAAALLGVAFLGIKAYEYASEYAEGLLPIAGGVTRFSTPVQHAFMDLYLVATGLHAVHLSIGIAMLLVVAARLRGLVMPDRQILPATVGLYWHLVDVVWVFLYPVLYLAR